MPNGTAALVKGLTYPLTETADNDGVLVPDASVVYVSSDPSIVRVNDPGFVTDGGATMDTHSVTALANGSADVSAKGTDAEGDEVDAMDTMTVSTVEPGTLAVGVGVA